MSSYRSPEEWEWLADRLGGATPTPGLDHVSLHPVDHVAIRDGGRRLRLVFGHGSFEAFHRVDVTEQPWRVCVKLRLGRKKPPGGEGPWVWTMELRMACVDVHLDEPLGDRALAMNDVTCP